MTVAYAALLRGVNVGGRRKVPMVALREVAAELDYGDVATYVQSGNLVLTASEDADTVARRLQEAITAAFGFDVAVIVRSATELAAIVRDAPLAGAATDPARYVVLFLAAPIAPGLLDGLEVTAPDELVARERELHLWLPDGQGRSKLAQSLDPGRLGVMVTARNWRTVEKLQELTAARQP